MESNQTWITEVILLGFQVDPDLELFLFGFFLLFCSFTLMGNGIILGLICLESRLHTPMYVFLSHLAIVDMSYASSTVPKMLANLVMHKKVISFAPCILQTFLYLAFAITECLILVVMCYDRYVAICHPLQYTLIMNWRVCTVLASTCWIFSFLLALVHITLILRLPFCGPQKINHFFCQIMPVFKLACADTRLNQAVLFAGSALVLGGPLCLVLVSYSHILARHRHVHGPQVKPFSRTEEDPFPVLQPFQPDADPLIYSLRNAEVKGALKRVLWKQRSM
uniref:Olfactory receptor n=1 Tax=Pongo abelii TaxID=9601 RepID=A0A8I5U1F3_PONAB